MWAEPYDEHLRQIMRHVYTHREDAAANAQRAKDMVTNQMLERLSEINHFI